ncbi:hypothetical protein [Burkholderia sp. Ac-20353]|uniref:hypothetical protein n=1 Tax=Burkholderia sp. Ac-20353 TaxID=2703894 RepID=UPI00197B5408|nr:hypothetical protein [Burkholderia sp. Ac-20353]MBN3788469.1 hypothetical protein [Burkholderia sp. Ac-20353]
MSLVVACFGGITIVAVFLALPKEFVAAERSPSPDNTLRAPLVLETSAAVP